MSYYRMDEDGKLHSVDLVAELRDQFAMSALPMIIKIAEDNLSEVPICDVASDCYDFADAMLKARLANTQTTNNTTNRSRG